MRAVLATVALLAMASTACALQHDRGLNMAPIYPPANETKAINLTPSMQAYYTTTNGAGTRYAACRVGAPRACDTGLQCCGYLGSQAWTAEPNRKMPDTCVSARPTECPRTVVGAQGGPCGKRGTCMEGLICCRSVLYLGGMTDVPIPTCQNRLDGCPPAPRPSGYGRRDGNYRG